MGVWVSGWVCDWVKEYVSECPCLQVVRDFAINCWSSYFCCYQAWSGLLITVWEWRRGEVRWVACICGSMQGGQDRSECEERCCCCCCCYSRGSLGFCVFILFNLFPPPPPWLYVLTELLVTLPFPTQRKRLSLPATVLFIFSHNESGSSVQDIF